MVSGKQSILMKNLRFNPLENVLFAFLGAAMFFCILLLSFPLAERLTANYQSIDFLALLELGIGGVVVFFIVFAVVSVLQLGTTINIIAKKLDEMESK